MRIHKNSFGDHVVYVEGKYVAMAMREVDGVWVAILASEPRVATPCSDVVHALTTAIMLVEAERVTQ